MYVLLPNALINGMAEDITCQLPLRLSGDAVFKGRVAQRSLYGPEACAGACVPPETSLKQDCATVTRIQTCVSHDSASLTSVPDSSLHKRLAPPILLEPQDQIPNSHLTNYAAIASQITTSISPPLLTTSTPTTTTYIATTPRGQRTTRVFTLDEDDMISAVLLVIITIFRTLSPNPIPLHSLLTHFPQSHPSASTS